MSDNYNVDQNFIKIPINKIKPNVYNNNVFQARMFERLKQSIKAEGFTVPIIVRYKKDEKMFEIVDGEHRYKAMKELGYKEITAKVISDEDRDNINRLKHKLLTINYNKIKGYDDVEKTSKLLDDIQKEYELDSSYLSELTGYSVKEVDLYIESVREEIETDYSEKLRKEFYKIDKERSKKNRKKSKLAGKHSVVYKLDKHYIVKADITKRNQVNKFLKKKHFANLIFFEITPDLILDSNIAINFKQIYDNFVNKLDIYGSFLLGTPNFLNKKGSKHLYEYQLIPFIINNYQYILQDSIIVSEDYGKFKDFLNGYKTYHHFSTKSNDYKFNQINLLDFHNATDSFIGAKYKSKASLIEKKLPYNLFKDATVLKDSFNKAMILAYTDINDVVIDINMHNPLNILSCEENERIYIGVTNNMDNIKIITEEWEKYTHKEATLIEEDN